VEGALRIEAIHRADAECIADALAEHDLRIELESEASVTVSGVGSGVGSGAVLMAVLDALQSCLDANTIAAVKVSIDDRHYVMEGAGRPLRACAKETHS
jgi:hypothetical protein